MIKILRRLLANFCIGNFGNIDDNKDLKRVIKKKN